MAKLLQLVCPRCSEAAEYPELLRKTDALLFCPHCAGEFPYDQFAPAGSTKVLPAGHISYSSSIPSEDNGRTFPLKHGDNTVGRMPADGAAKATISVSTTDFGLSRCHLTIRVSPEGTFCFLSGAKNATYCGDKLLSDGESVPLHDGDRITCSASVFVFHAS